MKRILFLIGFAFLSTAVQAQVIQKESDLTVENDTILNDTIELPEIIVRKEKLDIESQMADPTIYSDTQKFHVVEKSYQDKNALIRSMNKEYEIAFNDLVLLESK